MRALVEELEDYYSRRSSQEWESSSPDRSVDAGAGDVARSNVLGGEDSKNHLGIIYSSVYSMSQGLTCNTHK
jgi:hypothetical protein